MIVVDVGLTTFAAQPATRQLRHVATKTHTIAAEINAAMVMTMDMLLQIARWIRLAQSWALLSEH
jgi:hypothetical protein